MRLRREQIMNRVINFHDVKDQDWFEHTILILKRKYQMLSLSFIFINERWWLIMTKREVSLFIIILLLFFVVITLLFE